MYIQNLCFQVSPTFSRALLDRNICSLRQFVKTVSVACFENNDPRFLRPSLTGFPKEKLVINDAGISVSRGCISDIELARITTPVDGEYDSKRYEHLVGYTDAITYIHPTRAQTMASLTSGREVNLKKVPCETGKPFD